MANLRRPPCSLIFSDEAHLHPYYVIPIRLAMTLLLFSHLHKTPMFHINECSPCCNNLNNIILFINFLHRIIFSIPVPK